jgi:hypothetical protein
MSFTWKFWKEWFVCGICSDANKIYYRIRLIGLINVEILFQAYSFSNKYEALLLFLGLKIKIAHFDSTHKFKICSYLNGMSRSV